MNRERHFHDASTGKAWSTATLVGVVRVRSGSNTREKTFSGPAEALSFALKEEWSRLKKGYTLFQPQAGPGTPCLHRYLAGAHTGAMVLEPWGDDLLCSRYNDRLQSDCLYRLDRRGQLLDTVEVPGRRLVWAARWCSGSQQWLLNADHQILRFDPADHSFTPLTNRPPRPASCLAVAGDTGAWYEGHDLVVTHLPTAQTRWRCPLECELYAGHSLQLRAQLSPDGACLACCSHSGEITLFDATDGRRLAEWKGDFAMIDQLEFTPDGRFLLAQEKYGKYRLLCLELSSLQPPADWPDISDSYPAFFALQREGRRLAVARRDGVHILEFPSMRAQLHFPVEHQVKSCIIQFVSNELAVLTDNGCLSLYALD